MHKIALTSSSPLSGKTTLAKYLEQNYKFIRADHSRTLVASFVDNWNNPISDPSEMISVEKVYREKEIWRPQLQAYGYQVGYNDPERAKYWVRRTLSEWSVLYGGKQDVVFDSFRGELQAGILRSAGFMLVQLEIDEAERMYRARAGGVDYERMLQAMAMHPELEGGIAKPDLTLNGGEPVNLLAWALLKDDLLNDRC